jgi:hypothetical protein
VYLKIRRLIRSGFGNARESLNGIEPVGEAVQGSKILLCVGAEEGIADGNSPFLQKGGIAAVDKFRVQADLIELNDHIL